MSRMFERQDRRTFNLKPRYWDPEKEAREEREKRIKAELGLMDDENYTPHIRGEFRKEYNKRKASRSTITSSQTIRLFMILVLLFIVAFFVYIKNPEGIMRFFGL